MNIHDGTESDHLLDKDDSDNENNNAAAQFNIAEAQVHCDRIYYPWSYYSLSLSLSHLMHNN